MGNGGPLSQQHLPAGTTLFREGDFGTSMYLVVAGSLRMSKRVIEDADKILRVRWVQASMLEKCVS